MEPKVKHSGLAVFDKDKWCMKGDKREGPWLYQRWRRARVVPEVEGCERNLRCGVRIAYLKGDFLHQGLSKCLPLNAQEQALLPLHVVGSECNCIYITDAVVLCLGFCCTHHESIWGWRYGTTNS